MATFPSVDWFEALRQAMLAHAERYRQIGSADVTVVPTIAFPDGRVERYALIFEANDGVAVKQLTSPEELAGPQLVIEGHYAVWREMVENIRSHGRADLQHTLNYLTLSDWPLRVTGNGAHDFGIDRFYRYQESLQEFFNEAAAITTEFTA